MRVSTLPLGLAALLLAACTTTTTAVTPETAPQSTESSPTMQTPPASTTPATPTVSEATEFVNEAEATLASMNVDAQRAAIPKHLADIRAQMMVILSRAAQELR